jgi:hypothetical protein
MLSDAARTALTAKSDANAGMDAPSLGAVSDDVLIIVVERIGDADMGFETVGQAIGEAGAGQPIRIEADTP